LAERLEQLKIGRFDYKVDFGIIVQLVFSSTSISSSTGCAIVKSARRFPTYPPISLKSIPVIKVGSII